MHTCPRRPILDDPVFYGELFWSFRNFQKGHFYDEGATGSQPAALVDSFRVMEQTLDLIENHRREQDAKRRARAKKVL
jgi:hypothetical protein